MAAQTSGYRPSQLRQEVLRIYTWEEFFAPNVIASFEKALGVKVVLDTFDSNEAMFEKLKSSPCGYDIITPSSYIISSLAKAGLIAKLNHRHLPNVRKNLDRHILPLLIDPRLTYNVPYTLNYTGIHYDRNRLPEGADPKSFDILGHPKLGGRTALFNDMREMIGAGLMHLGYSINSLNPEEIDQAADQIIRWKRLAKRFDDAFYADDVSSGKIPVAMSYSYLAIQAICQANAATNQTGGVAQAFTLPRTGGYSLSVDEFVIGADSKNPKLAHAFINFIYDADVACSSIESRYNAMPVRPAMEKLNPQLRQLITLTPEQFKRGQVIMSLGSKADQLYERAWKRIQAAK